MSGRIELAAQELVDRHGDPLNNIEDSVLWCANSEKPLQGPQYFRRIPLHDDVAVEDGAGDPALGDENRRCIGPPGLGQKGRPGRNPQAGRDGQQ